MRGKREFIAGFCAATGLTRLLEQAPRRNVLLGVNYHRVGNPEETPYDPGTFSATAQEFDWQIEHLKRRYPIVTLERAIETIGGGRTPREPGVLITFDDGYIDNYRIAFPILRKHGVSAVFFLPTAFVGSGRLPWWDVVAYIVKRSRKETFSLEYPEPATFHPARDGMDRCLSQVMSCCYQLARPDIERFVEQLEASCESPRPDSQAERCFLSWEEAREMHRGGMGFGSHTHSHEVLGKLPFERQCEELTLSRDLLRRELNLSVDTLAYPIGLRHTFSDDTLRALRQLRYQAAFSNYGGINKAGAIEAFDVRRCAAEARSRPRWRLQLALATSPASCWF